MPATSSPSSQGKRIAVANPERTALLIMKFHTVIDAHCLVYGGMNVRRRAWIGSGFGPFGVTRSIYLSASNASPGKNERIDTGMMISSAIAVDLGGTPEIGKKDDEGFVEHTAHFQISQ